MKVSQEKLDQALEEAEKQFEVLYHMQLEKLKDPALDLREAQDNFYEAFKKYRNLKKLSRCGKEATNV